MKCNKRRYRTELDAKIAMANMDRNGYKPNRPELDKRREKRYYRCPDCAGYHTTSQDKRAKV